jgi:hypothetical protein
MSSLSILDHQIVDVLAKSITTYLVHRDHVESITLSPEMIPPLLREIQRRRGSDLNNHAVSDAEILQKAQEKAALFYQEQCLQSSVTPEMQDSNSAKSVSLFQSTGGTQLDNFITFELIRERAENSHDILNMLLKIQYIDDLIADWDEITQFLRSELSTWLSNAETAERVAPFCVDFISLHRQWFDMTRKGIHSSKDYQMVQVTLVQNLIDAVRSVENMNVNGNRQLDFQRQCLCTILDMFCDWMDRNIAGGPLAHDPAIRQIGITLWDWCTTASKQVDDYSDILRRHRPHGQWIYQWFTQCFTVEELISFLERSTSSGPNNPYNTLYRLVQETRTWITVIERIEHLPKIDLYRLFHEAFTCVDIGLPSKTKETDDIPSNGIYAVWTIVWLLSTIRSVLCVTRVSRFPWYLLEASTDGGTFERFTMDPHKCYMQLWKMFWLLFHWIQPKCLPLLELPLDLDAVRVICADGMEVLLRGVPLFTQSIMLSDFVDGTDGELLRLLKQRSCE